MSARRPSGRGLGALVVLGGLTARQLYADETADDFRADDEEVEL